MHTKVHTRIPTDCPMAHGFAHSLSVECERTKRAEPTPLVPHTKTTSILTQSITIHRQGRRNHTEAEEGRPAAIERRTAMKTPNHW